MSIPFPKVRVERHYSFRAWHQLPASKNPMAKTRHWHDYKMVVILDHEANPNGAGWAFDYDEIDSRVKPIIEELDGCDLNELCPYNPTSEMVACWVLSMFPEFVSGVRVSENNRSSAEIMKKNINVEWLNKFRDYQPHRVTK